MRVRMEFRYPDKEFKSQDQFIDLQIDVKYDDAARDTTKVFFCFRDSKGVAHRVDRMLKKFELTRDTVMNWNVAEVNWTDFKPLEVGD